MPPRWNCGAQGWGLGAGRAARLPAAVAGLLVLCVSAAGAQVRLTQEEALRLAFPPSATIDRRTAFLGDSDLAAVRRLAGPEVPRVTQRVISYYVAMADQQPVGVAYFDVHRVRTLNEVLMVVVTPEARIARIEILQFSEPPEYRAPQGWLAQFQGDTLSEELSLKGDIVAITGATLTSQAVTLAARRVLALHRVIAPFATRGR